MCTPLYPTYRHITINIQYVVKLTALYIFNSMQAIIQKL